MNKDPYTVLGIARDATEEEIKAAYRKMARRYHPDNYAADPAAAREAEEKMKEINEAYDLLTRKGGATGTATLSDVRQMINTARFAEAELLLDGMPEAARVAEWHYLKAVVLMRRGWQNDAMREVEIACRMDPQNAEYARVRDMFHARFSNFGGAYRQQRDGRYDRGAQDVHGCSSCDICTTLICCDCCCESFGFDLVRCI